VALQPPRVCVTLQPPRRRHVTLPRHRPTRGRRAADEQRDPLARYQAQLDLVSSQGKAKAKGRG
jgi:hypothetical protein